MVIPVIEFGLFRKGNPIEKQRVAEDVLQAFKNVGFVYLADHGIPQSQVDTVFDLVISYWYIGKETWFFIHFFNFIVQEVL